MKHSRVDGTGGNDFFILRPRRPSDPTVQLQSQEFIFTSIMASGGRTHPPHPAATTADVLFKDK